jgi:ABC-type transporter Mla subunit MlaD
MQQERTLLSELAERQKQEAQTFMSFKSELFSNMNTVSTSVKEMQESNRVLSGTINALVGPAQEVTRQQNTLMTSAQDTVKLLNEHVADQKRIVEQQEYWGKELQKTLNTLNSSTKQSDALVSGISGFTEQQKGLLEAIKQEREQQVQMANHMLTTAENLKKAVEQVNQCLIEWQAVNVNMYHLMQRVSPAIR